MSLKTYLTSSHNSLARESICNHRLAFDLKLAAASREYYLQTYTPSVDKDGFDIIFDDIDVMRKIQVKTVMDSSGTENWPIRKGMLRPTIDVGERLGFESSPNGIGVMGGVILMEVSPGEEDLSVSYFYTDILIVVAFMQGIISRDDTAQQEATHLVHTLSNGSFRDKIKVPKDLFLNAVSPGHLLALLDLHGPVSGGNWFNNILRINDCESGLDQQVSEAEINAVKRHVWNALNDLCMDKLIKPNP